MESIVQVLLIGGCGYVGSALYRHLQAAGFAVDTVDLEWFGNAVNPANGRRDYRGLTVDELAPYAAVVLLAAHSSVAMAGRDANAAFANNLTGFQELTMKLRRDQRFVYASSSSVYSGSGATVVDESWSRFNVSNMYDLTKYSADGIMGISSLNYYGLRFGTVNGASPNLRTDLMINRMVLTAAREGRIELFNPGIHRPILGLVDLCRAVEAILRGPSQPGIYNLSSFTTTVGQVAEAVSSCLGVEIRRGQDGKAYDFSMTSEKFAKAYDFTFVETVDSIVASLQRLTAAGPVTGGVR